MAKCYNNKTFEQAHSANEQEKKRRYAERINRVEQGTFTPLVFTTSGGMAKEANIFYKRLAQLIADKKKEPRSYITAWLRTRMSFALVRSALLCLRGSRSSNKKYVEISNIDFEQVVVESRIEKLE